MEHTGDAAGEVTALLARWAAGDARAAAGVFTLAYEELRALARAQRRRWRGDGTLDTTALVHEAYLKLAGGSRLVARERAHFLAVASRAMRQVLANYARARRAGRRGGDAAFVPLDEALAEAPEAPTPEEVERLERLEALEGALERLEAVSPRQCRVVECRFLGQLSIGDTAVALGVSEATVKRDWTVAQAWLHRELGPLAASP